jgi:protein-tyrosine-phosphatase
MMHHVLVLCHANRYRSPLVAAFLAREGLHVRSAGFMRSGLRAGKPVRDVAKLYGLDINDHVSTQVDDTLMAWATDVVLMNRTHLLKLELLYPCKGSQQRVLLGGYANPPANSIPDLAYINPRSPKYALVIGLIGQASRCYAASLTRR